ncbi:MAG: 4Fe-4S dicluster domain-containing protein [Chloroflexi bacterium]|nr:4Fe-4S dicluster domain-containing protein [Chloroflexota bacterium]
MSVEFSIEAKLGQDTFKVDKGPHIVPDPAVCRTCGPKWCIKTCPAHLYAANGDGSVTLNFEGCLECGTCLVACLPRSLDWHYPRGGFGVQLRYG